MPTLCGAWLSLCWLQLTPAPKVTQLAATQLASLWGVGAPVPEAWGSRQCVTEAGWACQQGPAAAMMTTGAHRWLADSAPPGGRVALPCDLKGDLHYWVTELPTSSQRVSRHRKGPAGMTEPDRSFTHPIPPPPQPRGNSYPWAHPHPSCLQTWGHARNSRVES